MSNDLSTKILKMYEKLTIPELDNELKEIKEDMDNTPLKDKKGYKEIEQTYKIVKKIRDKKKGGKNV